MTRIEHFFLTNRLVQNEVIVDRDRLFGDKNQLRFGKIESSDKGNKILLYSDGKDSTSYKDCLTKRKDKLVGHARLFRELYDATRISNKGILLFVHGYYHSFARLQKTAELVYKTHIADSSSNLGHLLLFSWPAGDELDEYKKDAISAAKSGENFLEFVEEWCNFLKLAIGDPDERKRFAACMNLAVASMGNQMLESFASQMPDEFDTDLKPFNEIILTAPDVGRDAFEPGQPLQKLPKIAGRVLCHYNLADNVLLLSETIGGNTERRLGKWGPTARTKLIDNLIFLNVTAVVIKALLDPSLVFNKDTAGYPIEHSYFVRLKRIKEDSKQQFRHVKTISIKGRVKIKGQKYYLCIRNNCLPGLKGSLDFVLETEYGN